MPFGVNPITGRSGPAPDQPRDGDKEQARQRINVEVRTNRRPHPNSLPCVECGHVYAAGERRHEYHHHLGYDAGHHQDVIPLCTECHAKTESKEVCKRGHSLTGKNCGHSANGRRFCRECRRMRDRSRLGRNAEYWRQYRSKRKAKC